MHARLWPDSGPALARLWPDSGPTMLTQLGRGARRGGQAMVKQYSQARIGDLPPHIFAIAEASFYNMRTLNENQSVIISGTQIGVPSTRVCAVRADTHPS